MQSVEVNLKLSDLRQSSEVPTSIPHGNFPNTNFVNNSQIARLSRAVFKIVLASNNYQQYGSGVILSAQGLAVTALHVLQVDGSRRWQKCYAEVFVRTSSGVALKRAPYRVVSHSEKHDLALIQLPEKYQYCPVKLSKTSPVVKSFVYALGFSNGSKTIAVGKVMLPCADSVRDAKFRSVNRSPARLTCKSAMVIDEIIGRDLRAGNVVSTNIIHHGCSGGALLNENGQLVGITTAYKTNLDHIEHELLDIAGLDLNDFEFPDRLTISKPVRHVTDLLA